MSGYMRGLRARIGTDLVLLPSVTVLVADERRRVLLVRGVETGQWVLPGGAMEPGETPADAAVREVWEETGLRVTLSGLFGVYGGPEFRVRYRNGDEVAFVMTVFAARAPGEVPRPDGEETAETRYVAATDVAALDTPAWVGIVLADAAAAAGPGARFRPAAWAPPGLDTGGTPPLGCGGRSDHP